MVTVAKRLIFRRIFSALVALFLVSSVSVALTIAPSKTATELAIISGNDDDNGEVALETVPETKPTATSSASSNKTAAGNSSAKPVTNPSKSANVANGELVGSEVSVIGDSVTLVSANKIKKALPGADVDGKVSRNADAGLMIAKQWASSGRMRKYLVIGLATNTYMTESVAESFVTVAGPDRKVVFVTGYGPKAEYWIEKSNRSIAVVAKKYPDRVRVADWASAIADHRNYLAKDNTHPDGRGASVFANTVVKALKSFS